MNNFLRLLLGLAFVIFIAFIAKYFSGFVAIGTVATAIILGIIIGNLLPIHKNFTGGISFAEKKLLSVAIMLLGVQLNISALHTLGIKIIVLIFLIIGSAITVGFLVGKLFKLPSTFALLIGIGNGICGSSAIAGASPLLQAKKEETALSISVVNFLGTIGIFLLPFLTRLFFGDSDVKSGVIIGGTLQAVGQVTAAGFAIGDKVGEIATIVKMGRILMLGPILLFFSVLLRKNNPSDGKRKTLSIPWFITGFIVLAILVNVSIIPLSWIPIIKRVSKELLIIAMTAIGLKITFSSVIQQGPKALLVGIIVFIVQISLALAFVIIFY